MKKHMNNVKVINTKGTIPTSFSHKWSPKSSTAKRYSKSKQDTRRKTPTLTCEFSQSQEAAILKSHVCTGAPPRSTAYTQSTLP